MDLEDQQRYEIDIDFWGDEASFWCTKCRKELADPNGLTLADLNHRADEHTEVCR